MSSHYEMDWIVFSEPLFNGKYYNSAFIDIELKLVWFNNILAMVEHKTIGKRYTKNYSKYLFFLKYFM